MRVYRVSEHGLLLETVVVKELILVRLVVREAVPILRAWLQDQHWRADTLFCLEAARGYSGSCGSGQNPWLLTLGQM